MKRVDDQLKRLQGEKRSFDILSLAVERMVKPVTFYGEKGESSTEAHHASGKDSKGEIERITMSSGKRQKMIHGCEEDHKQNPNRDACSTSLCSVESKRREQVVTNKKVKRREPVEERGRTPEWLVKVMREENGTDVKMITKKDLVCSDLNEHYARLLIPWNGITDMDFMNEEELGIVHQHYIKATKKGLDITLVDLKGKRWGLNLRRWDMGPNSNYVLATGWNKVAAENELEIGQTLRIWSFRTLGKKVVAGADRTPDKLFIAFVPLDPAPALSLVRDPAPSSPRAQAEAQEESDRVFPVPYYNWEDPNILAEVCERTTRLEALQEADRRSSLVPVTELDLELRL
ncbi:PREDICTED: B3 domain-containing protein At2g31720-like [Camelina sativa]|uniref:B3 domain-containing protein At2g31720-like n=1 Tax=Camelina sativa TaxID=90675 RepID=A0ABM0ZBA0_CAMSA|nr:PREDICTED: B3 domain-containing protein At2g31720-like [Camelina sativa]